MEKEKTEEEKKKKPFAKKAEAEREKVEESLVRIVGTDIPGKSSVYSGLTRIKGMSWSMSNALCISLGIDKSRKINSLSEKETGMITSFIKNPKVPEWMLNRRKDFESGASKHLLTSELDFARESDIRLMKKMKSYKGWRHALGQPVRGQRTRSHFRKGASVGVAKGRAAKAAIAEKAGGGKKK